MKYTVVWTEQASDELASIWLRAADRDAVTSASARLDYVLGIAPLDHGESRDEGSRILIVLPLVVEYEVDDADRRVQVKAIWRARTSP